MTEPIDRRGYVTVAQRRDDRSSGLNDVDVHPKFQAAQRGAGPGSAFSNLSALRVHSMTNW